MSINKDIDSLFNAVRGTSPQRAAAIADPAVMGVSVDDSASLNNTPTETQAPAPTWLDMMNDPTFDPFALNTSEEVVEETPPEEAIDPNAPEVLTNPPQEQTQAQTGPTPEQIAAYNNQLQQQEAQLDVSLQKFYALPSDIAETLPDGLAEIIQKQNIKAHKAVVNHVQAILRDIQTHTLPTIIQQTVDGRKIGMQAETEFFGLYPQLKEERYANSIAQIAQAMTMSGSVQGKSATERLLLVGAAVAAAHGLDPRPSTTRASAPSSAPAPSAGNNSNTNRVPVRPARASAGPSNQGNKPVVKDGVSEIWDMANAAKRR